MDVNLLVNINRTSDKILAMIDRQDKIKKMGVLDYSFNKEEIDLIKETLNIHYSGKILKEENYLKSIMK